MMKKIILSLCLFLTCCLPFTNLVSATEYYYEETIEIIDSTPSSRVVNTITGKKTKSMKNSAGNVLWYVSVTGTFVYTGSKSSCTISTVEAKSNNKFWKILSKSSSKSANKAIATAKAQNILDGEVVATHVLSTTLTCSATGKLS